MDGDEPVPGVDADENGAGACGLDCRRYEVRVVDGGGSEDGPVGPGFEGRFDCMEGPQAAAKLEGNIHGAGDAPHYLEVVELSGLGAVEIDDVKPGGALFLPLPGDGHGVGRVGGLAVVVALEEADDAALAQVYGGDYFHCAAAGASAAMRAKLA